MDTLYLGVHNQGYTEGRVSEKTGPPLHKVSLTKGTVQKVFSLLPPKQAVAGTEDREGSGPVRHLQRLIVSFVKCGEWY